MSTVTVRTPKRKATRDESVAAAKRAKRAYQRKKYGGMVNTKTHNFVRAVFNGNADRYGLTADSAAGYQLNGVNTTFFNMQFAFTLAGVQVSFGGTYSHTLPMPNYTELTALYDEYRIDWVDCEFYFSNNNSSVNTPATTLPIMYCAKDYDDANAALIADLMQYSTLSTWQLGTARKHSVRVKPNVDVAVYNTAVTSGYARGKPQFIDTGSPNVPHYGVKIAYDPINYPGAGTVLGYMGVVFKYHLTMAHSK